MATLLGLTPDVSWSLHDTLCLCVSTPAWTRTHTSSTQPVHVLIPAPHSPDSCSHQPHTACPSAHTNPTQPGHMLTPAPHSLDTCSHQLHTDWTGAHTSSTSPHCFSHPQSTLPPFGPFHCGPFPPQYALEPSVTLSRCQFANCIFNISSLTLNL